MQRYFTEKISKEKLEERIKKGILEKVSHEDMEDLIKFGGITGLEGLNVFKIIYYACSGYLPSDILTNLTPQIRKDLSKVRFDLENFSVGDDFNNSGLCGYQTLENGLTFLGFEAGGDWEFPVFSMIYWDGKELRGYIPTKGNPWNTSTKMAYGNYEEEDERNMRKRFGTREFDELRHNKANIIKDISERIQYREVKR